MISINTEKEISSGALFSEYMLLRETCEENYEFINGEIIKMYSPSTSHQDVVLNLTLELKQFFKNSKCKVMISPYDVYLEKDEIEKQNCVIPDISVMCNKDGFEEKRYRGVPTIIVEVLSSNWADDMIKKFKLYQEYGVEEYWVIDPNSKQFMVWRYNNHDKKYYSVEQVDTILSSNLFQELKINMTSVFES